MILFEELQEYLDNLMNFDPKLDPQIIDPYMTNGLLVKGTEKIEKIGFAVSASIEVFKQAKQNNCRVLIVHHTFPLPANNNFDEIFHKRYSYLVKNEISLFGYHFLLDAHPQIGNNVSILKTVGANPTTPYLHRGDPWGFKGKFVSPVKFSEIKNILTPHLSPRSIFYEFGTESIKNVVAVSGMGAPNSVDMNNLIKEKIGLFITGEVHEWNRELFREAGINFIAGGHYHTEMFGIKALMEKIKKDLPQISPVWLDLTNEV